MNKKLKNTLMTILVVVLIAGSAVLGFFANRWFEETHEHTYSVLQYDETHHWKECTNELCSHKAEIEEHIDEDENDICDKCNYGATAMVNGVNYTSIQDAIDASSDAVTITLYKDVVSGGLKTEDTKEITLDLNGYTLFVSDPLVGSAGTQTLGFQFLKGSKVTIKNGTIKRVGPAKMLIQNYSDLTLENVTIDAKSDTIETPCYYALSNNCGTIVIKGNTNIIADEGQVAFDLWYGMYSVYDEGVYVTFDETFTGRVEGKIEYGAARDVDGWKSKTVLTIKGGDFSDTTFVASSTYSSIEDANIVLPEGKTLVEIENSDVFVIA